MVNCRPSLYPGHIAKSIKSSTESKWCPENACAKVKDSLYSRTLKLLDVFKDVATGAGAFSEATIQSEECHQHEW